MAVHDWTRVGAGTYHDFHNSWLVMLKAALNAGALPSGYYAQVEQHFPRAEADVLTLERPHGLVGSAARPRTIAVRHASGHRPVAVIELTSFSNKDRAGSVEEFVAKAVGALDSGVHVVVLDLLPAGKPDPQGMPGAVWAELGNTGYQLPAGKRLSFASFVSAPKPEFYADPLAPGDPPPETPLFLAAGHYVPLPLAGTYAAAFQTVPEVWREVLERP